MITLTSQDVNAVIALMGDRSDPELLQLLRKQLCHTEIESLQDLRLNCRYAPDHVAMAVDSILQERVWEHLALKLHDLRRRKRPDLLELLVLLAQFGHPETAENDIRQHIARLHILCDCHITENSTTLARASGLAAFLGDELGFRGGGEQPIIPNHLFVDQIIAGRQGTALSLSALYVILGRKLGIPLECVALMDYFVVGVFDHPRDSEPMLYLDPLHRGRVLSARDCARIVEDQGAQFVEEVLNPVPTDLIFARMLHKLYGVLEKAGDFSRCDALLGFIELWDAVEV